MSNAGTTISDTLSAAAANLLSTFNTNGGNGMTLSGLFQNLLASAENSDQDWTKTQSAAALTGSSSQNASVTSSSDTDNGTAPTLTEAMHEIVSALRDFNARWNNNHNQSDDSRKPAKSAGTDTNSSQGTQDTTNASPASSTTDATASSDDTSATSTTDASNGSPDQTPTLVQLAAELQAVLHMIQKALQTTPTAAGDTSASASATAATGTSGDTSNQQELQGLLTAGSALGELLALAQKLEKKSDPTSQTDAATGSANDPTGVAAGTATATANPAAATDTTEASLLAIDAKLKNDLQSLIGSLKAAVANSTQTEGTAQDASTASAASTATATANASADGKAQFDGLFGKHGLLNFTPAATASNAAVTTPTDASAAATPAANSAVPSNTTSSTPNPDDIIKNALNAADDVVNQLVGLYPAAQPQTQAPATTTPATTLAAGVTLSAERSANADLDANANKDGGANLASTNTGNTTPLAVDNPKSAGLYSFASQLSETRAQTGATGLPSAVEQVLMQMNRNARTGSDQMSLQLHPADLGTINVKLDFARDGSVTGTVTASNPDTLNMLQKDSRSLERALQDAGLRADPGSLQFNLGGQSNQSNPGQNGATGGASSGSSASNTNGGAAITPDADSDATAAETWVITPGRVNIRV